MSQLNSSSKSGESSKGIVPKSIEEPSQATNSQASLNGTKPKVKRPKTGKRESKELPQAAPAPDGTMMMVKNGFIPKTKPLTAKKKASVSSAKKDVSSSDRSAPHDRSMENNGQGLFVQSTKLSLSSNSSSNASLSNNKAT